MIVTRRGFLTSLLAAPIIVRPGILMPVRPIVSPPSGITLEEFERLYIMPAIRSLEEQFKAEFARDYWKPMPIDYSGLFA